MVTAKSDRAGIAAGNEGRRLKGDTIGISLQNAGNTGAVELRKSRFRGDNRLQRLA